MKFDFTDSKNIGKEYKGFVLLSIDDLPDYKTKAVYLRHKRTGLEIYHILKDDNENLFAFAFRTISKDSKGCAHIMEHSTLCGSEKYPLKEPFTTLAGQSINTFLNALTYPDKTVYPAASVVRSDYFNMMDVYADSVFFPKLDYKTFIQEGYRLELDEKDQMSIQGVVYNEMKGNYSSFMQIAYSDIISTMFPDSYPAFDSGGDPLEIPNLSYEEFIAFHQKFYNPDNCILFLYGDIPTQDQIDFLNEKYIPRIEKKYNCTKDVANFDQKTPLIKKEVQDLLKLNMRKESAVIKTYAPQTGSTGSIVSMSWYSGISDMEKYYLSEVLLGNDSSPLSKLLKDSKLGDDLFCGNFGQFEQEFFTLGLIGVKKEKEQKVYDLIKKSIFAIYNDGIEKKDIDSAVMGIDFALREENRYWGPVSIQIMEKALKGWTIGKTCSNQLTPITSFEHIKQKIKEDPEYTKNLIKKYFIDNQTVIKFVAEPSSKYFENRNQIEEKNLQKLSANVNKDELKKQLNELHEYQQKTETQEELACIPRTKKSELDGKIDIPQIKLELTEGFDKSEVPLFVSEEETNGIFYVDILYPFDRLHPSYYKHIPLLSTVITNLGWDGKNWDDCISESACVMGDVWGHVLTGKLSSAGECKEKFTEYEKYNILGRKWIGFSCKALTEKSKETFDLLAKIITKMDFKDEKRFASMLKETILERKTAFVQSGKEYAVRRAKCTWNENNALSEIMWGVSQNRTLSKYKNFRKLLKTYKFIYEECLKSGAVIHITADKSSLKKLLPQIRQFIIDSKITKLLPKTKYELKDYLSEIYKVDNYFKKDKTEIIKVHSQTGYAVTVTPSSEYLTKEAAAESVFASWFSMHTLWEKFRFTGGAYGASVWPDNIDNTLIMSTYRDPSPQKSYDVYIDALKEISQVIIPEEDIERSIVSIYGDAIVPMTPKDRAKGVFEGLLFANYGFKPLRVKNILNVSSQDVQKAAQNLYEMAQNKHYNVVFCDKSVKTSGNILKIPL